MASDVRQSRTVVGSLWVLLPVVLLLVLFSLAVGLAQISPGRVTTGVYQVVVWEGDDHVEIPTESLSCQRIGDTTTCTAPVGSRARTVELDYTGVVEPGGCTAQYGDRPVSCVRQLGFYGHASHTLWVHGLGLSPAQQADLRADVPWWRVESDLTTVAQVLLVALGVAAGGTTFLVRRRGRPVPARLRPLLVVGTAGLGFGLFAVTGPVISSVSDDPVLAVSPLSVLAVAALTAWQWELSGPPLGGRVGSAVIAGGATVFYSAVALLVFGLQSGFID